jgi:serine/threonine protein phosphatase 1
LSKKYVITDIHGCANTFRHLVEEKLDLNKEDKLYLLGDYINKGPRSKEVLDYIMYLRESKFQVYTLRGNHDQLLLDALDQKAEVDFLLRGGQITLKSFGVENVADVPEKYVDFIRGLDYYLLLEKWILVHAGFDFHKMDPFSDKEAMLNLRGMDIDDAVTKGRKIIHGHVPTPVEEIKMQLKDPERKEFTVDAGCVYDHRPGMYHMVALELESWTLFSQQNIE